MTRTTLITVTGMAYLQPIVDLAECMLRRPPRPIVAGRIGGLENGYAISIVLLLVVALESFVGRVSYLQSKLGPTGKPKPQKTSVPDYVAQLRKSFPLHKSLEEIFVLRDASAHGHVWELEVSDHETHLQVLHRATLLSGYGNNKHQRVLNANTRRSSAQGLDLVPSAVGVREVRKVADGVWKTLHFLARNSLLEPNAFEYRGRYQGRPFDFWSFRELLKNAA